MLVVDGGVAELSRDNPSIRFFTLAEAEALDEKVGSIAIGTTRSREEALPKILENIRLAGVDLTVVIGGDGSLTLAQKLEEAGLPTIGIPKSMDGNLAIQTEGGLQRLMSIGFLSSVHRVVGYIRDLERKAREDNKITILEVNGRDTGWIALTASRRPEGF